MGPPLHEEVSARDLRQASKADWIKKGLVSDVGDRPLQLDQLPDLYDSGNLVWVFGYRADHVEACSLNERVAEVVGEPLYDIGRSHYWYLVDILDSGSLTPSGQVSYVASSQMEFIAQQRLQATSPLIKRRKKSDEDLRQVAPQAEQPDLAIRAALENEDFAALHELAFQKHGFSSAQLRTDVWPFLLGLRSGDRVASNSWREVLGGHEDEDVARTIRVDVARSAYHWDVHKNLKDDERDEKRKNLSDILHAVLQHHPGKLSYYQGCHDVGLVLLEVGNPSTAFYMLERLALFFMSDHFCWPFEKGLSILLSVLFLLLERLDEPVALALREAECDGMHFAVPWLLTWFAHSLPRLDQVLRLFDCLLASHPAMILYFVVALIHSNRDAILQTPRELPDMMFFFQQLPLDALDIDEWAADAQKLAKRLPPEKFVKILPPSCRETLPKSSPLFNFPHPWMRGKSYSANGEISMAPVYMTHRDRFWTKVGLAVCLAIVFILIYVVMDGSRPTLDEL